MYTVCTAAYWSKRKREQEKYEEKDLNEMVLCRLCKQIGATVSVKLYAESSRFNIQLNQNIVLYALNNLFKTLRNYS